MNKKRKEIEELIYKTFMLLDPTGYNTKVCKEDFQKMSDSEFDKYMKEFLNNEEENFYLEITPFKNDALSIENIEAAANYLKVPLNEYVYMPYLNPEGEPIRTPEKCPVGYIHMKRLQQILSKKNSFHTGIDTRSAKLGQVINEDKAGVISDADNFSLVTIEAENSLKELLGPRSDDMSMKTDMLQLIERDGYVKMADLKSEIKNKQAINTLDVYFTGAGLKTDLITPGLALQKTLADKETKLAISKKYKE